MLSHKVAFVAGRSVYRAKHKVAFVSDRSVLSHKVVLVAERSVLSHKVASVAERSVLSHKLALVAERSVLSHAIQEGPTSRKHCKYRVKRLLWRYFSGCLRNNDVIIPPHNKCSKPTGSFKAVSVS